MKWVIVIVSTIAIGVVGTWMFWQRQSPENSKLWVLIDTTDEYNSHLESEDLVSFVGLDKDRWKGVAVAIRRISSTRFERSKTYQIAQESEIFGHSLKRFSREKEFMVKLNQEISSLRLTREGSNHSVIFPVLAQTLNEASKFNGGEAAVILESDLVENGLWFSFFSEEGHHLLEGLPETTGDLVEIFSNEVDLDDLSGVKVFLIHVPNDLQEERRFILLSSFYKALLESHGAQVEISSFVGPYSL